MVVHSLASFSGTCIVGTVVAAPGVVEGTWLNTDNQTATPAPSTGILFYLRQLRGVSFALPQGVLLAPSH